MLKGRTRRTRRKRDVGYGGREDGEKKEMLK